MLKQPIYKQNSLKHEPDDRNDCTDTVKKFSSKSRLMLSKSLENDPIFRIIELAHRDVANRQEPLSITLIALTFKRSSRRLFIRARLLSDFSPSPQKAEAAIDAELMRPIKRDHAPFR
jgi:hypothetical protein